jgi:hypothetical protein
MISSETLMMTIAWNPDCGQVIEVLPQRDELNADYSCSSVLTKLLKMARQFRSETRRVLILHADNTRPETAKSSIEFCAKLDLTVARHPSYSLDLAPSDYFLFGYI